MITLTALSIPFMKRAPLDLPPIVSVELIQITEKTNIPFAPKAREILEKIKKGADFSEVAKKYSDDPNRVKNQNPQNENAQNKL